MADFMTYEWCHFTPTWKSKMKGQSYLSNVKDCGVFTMKHMELFEGGAFDSDLGPVCYLFFFIMELCVL